VTRITLQRSRFVKQYEIPVDKLSVGVTLITLEVRVPALQEKPGFLVVIEGRGNPSLFIMANGTRGTPVTVGELPAVRLDMAGLTEVWNSAEPKFGLSRRCLVAGAAGHGAMCANQGKFGPRVIEAAYRKPRLGDVTRLATHG
jgi:hypothetical protein